MGWKKETQRIAGELGGSLLMAIGMYNFAVQALVPLTGISGVAEILYRLFGLPMGWLSLAMNVPLIILCYRALGRRFFIRSIRCMVFLSLMLDYVAPLLPVYTGDRMLAALCTGCICGVADALIYMQNSSSGGTDFATMAVKARKPHIPVGNLNFLWAMLVLAANAVLFRDIDGVIYGLIINFLSSVVVNRILFGVNSGMLALVVTTQAEKICQVIDRTVMRGSTVLPAAGGYSGAKKSVVMCACSAKQLYALEQVFKQVDPESFTVLLQSNEVLGNGFQRLVLGREEENREDR